MPYRLGELDMMTARDSGGLRMGDLYDAVAGCLAVTVAQQPDRGAAACSIVWAPSAAMPATFVSLGIGLASLGERADLIVAFPEPSGGGGDDGDGTPSTTESREEIRRHAEESRTTFVHPDARGKRMIAEEALQMGLPTNRLDQ
ncbi:uncharacterized protein PG986_008832 [Apiospora aurea]|uniref:Uncharacterized protein n=1 Tax=Apiospora aurea TaxID=335848 RepID=A0ABR1Q5W5_9PEZI